MSNRSATAQELFERPHIVGDEDVAFFREHGYVRFDRVLSSDEVALLREDVDRAVERRDTFSRDIGSEKQGALQYEILQMLNLWERYPHVRRYVFGKRMAGIAARLSGSESLRLYHDQALVKPPHSHAPSPWHQDQPYWPTRDPGMISCWMALDDVTVERGAMHFIPGSHHWGELPPVDFTGKATRLEDVLTKEQRAAWIPTSVELAAGSCTFHHGLTFHFTRPNETDHIRRALVTIYIPDGITYAGDEKMATPFDDTITSKKGEPLRGKLFKQIL